MKKIDLKAQLNKLKAFKIKLPKLSFKVADFKNGKLATKTKKIYSDIKLKAKNTKVILENFYKAIPFKKIAEKTKKALLGNKRTIFLGALTAVASVFVLKGCVTYVADTTHGEPSVVFNDKARRIVVYPQIDRVYIEEGRKFYQADFKRQFNCYGILGHYPLWLAPSPEKTEYYSMQACPPFGQEGNADNNSAFPGLIERRHEAEAYLQKAKTMPQELKLR